MAPEMHEAVAKGEAVEKRDFISIALYPLFCTNFVASRTTVVAQ